MRRWLILLALLMTACGARSAAPLTAEAPAAPQTAAPRSEAVELTVFAAASLTAAFQEIARGFEAANPGVTVVHNFAGSQQLAAQIAQGAPFDVFASANRRQLDDVVEAGRIDPQSAQPFAGNRLVVIYPAENPAEIMTLQDLAKPGVKIVLAAPAVPVGQYTVEFLEKASADPAFGADFRSSAERNVVSYEESVRAVLAKVATGEADAGVVYTTDVAADGAAQVGRLDIPGRLNSVASYPIAPASDSRRADLARAYIAYVLGAEGQAVLARYGFTPAPSS